MGNISLWIASERGSFTDRYTNQGFPEKRNGNSRGKREIGSIMGVKRAKGQSVVSECHLLWWSSRSSEDAHRRGGMPHGSQPTVDQVRGQAKVVAAFDVNVVMD